jgi:AcrR family transcriptional regulator
MATQDKLRARLSTQTIVDAALVIADSEGLGALSMRRVATDLSCAPMSLYEHVPSKEALLDLVADQAMTALPELDPGGNWRSELERFFAAFHELFLAHPAIAHVMVQRPLVGPVTIRRGEPALAVLTAAGFSDADAVECFIALASYTIGASLYEIARRDTTDRDTRLAELADEDHPTLQRVSEHLRGAAGDRQFLAGLHRLLDSYSG